MRCSWRHCNTGWTPGVTGEQAPFTAPGAKNPHIMLSPCRRHTSYYWKGAAYGPPGCTAVKGSFCSRGTKSEAVPDEPCACQGSTYEKLESIQRRLAWPLRKDDTQTREAFPHFDLLVLSPAPLEHLRGTVDPWLKFPVFSAAVHKQNRYT